jgi:saccharopine dehydrogenase (NADP+, L-glutamate forming)
MPSDHHALSYPSSNLLFPRIDHLYAVDIIDRVHKEGGSVRAFRSFCCGLPAPESMNMMTTHKTIEANFVILDSDNPLGTCWLTYFRGCWPHSGYKFSWSSRGVLLALKNEAKYLENGKEVYVRSEGLMGTAKPYHTGFLGFNFVAYGNRDSTGYRER